MPAARLARRRAPPGSREAGVRVAGARRRGAAGPRARASSGPGSPLVDDVAGPAAEAVRRAGGAPRGPRAAPAPDRHRRTSATSSCAVGPGVFVPRPETELLAGWAVEQAGAVAAAGRRPVVVDLGTGSGAIAKAVADEVPGRRRARRRARRARPRAGPRATSPAPASTCARATWPRRSTTWPAPSTSWSATRRTSRTRPGSRWPPRCATTTPQLALYAAGDGLDAIRVVERRAALLLRPGGVVGVEHADVQGESAPAVFAATGRWEQVRDHRDLAGRRALPDRAAGTMSPPARGSRDR